MWLRKIKYKKLQYILMTIILAASAMIFSANLSFVQEVTAATKDYYSEKNMPEVAVWAKVGAYDLIVNDEELSWGLSQIFRYEGKELDSIVKLNGEVHSGSAIVYPLKNLDDFVFTISIKEGNKNSVMPNEGEIWVPYIYADKNDIKINDIMTLGDKGNFRVAAFYIAPLTATIFINYAPFYVNTADYQNFSNCADQELTFFDAKPEYGARNAYFRVLDVARLYMRGATYRNTLYEDDTRTTQIAGNVSVVASLIMFIAALFISAYIVRSNLQNELKCIGTYKCLGYSNRKIIAIYFWGYLAVAFVASILGVIAGLPLIYAMSVPAVKYFTDFTLSSVSLICGGISVVLLTLITTLVLLLILGKIKKVKPVETINMGLRSNAKKLKKSVIKSARAPLSLAINEIFKYRASSILAIFMIVLSVFMSYTFGGVGYNMSFIDQKPGVYFGMPNGDAYIMGDNSLQNDIAKRSDVDSVILFKSIYVDMRIENSSAYTEYSMNIFALDNFDQDTTGMVYTSGREPITKDEIAMHEWVLNGGHFKVNDYVHISINGQTSKTYLIVGSFNCMISAYNSVRMFEPEIEEANITPMLCIKLKNGISYADFRNSMETDFGVFVYESIPSLKQMVSMIYGIIKTPINTMIMIFMGFSALIILNLLFMSYLDNKKSFGTLKALGITTRYITLKNLFKMLILAGAGFIIGLTLGLIFAPIIYEFVVYASASAFEFSFALPLEIAGTLLLLITSITLLFAIPISKIKPKILMEE